MNTHEATQILAFLLGSHRRYQSWQLSWAAKQRLASIQHALEAYEKLTFTSDQEALAQLNQIYQMLNAEPPPADSNDLSTRKHPLMLALDRPDPGAEMDSWKVFLEELRKLT
jgi:hypothetical protein